MRSSDNPRGLFVAQVGFKSLDTHSSGANFQQPTHNNPNHAPQESVCTDVESEAIPFGTHQQTGGTDPAKGMFEAGRRLAKSVIILVFRQQIHRRLHLFDVQIHIRIQGTTAR